MGQKTQTDHGGATKKKAFMKPERTWGAKGARTKERG